MVSAAAKIAIGAALAEQANNAESQLKKYKRRAGTAWFYKKSWPNFGTMLTSRPRQHFITMAIAAKENTFSDWVTAGSRFNDAFRFVQDTVANQPSFVLNAISMPIKMP